MITGSTGFIGKHLKTAMIEAGDDVHVLLRDQPIEETVNKVKPEVVIHLASLFLADHKPEQIADLCASNVTFGTKLVDAMVNAGCLNLVCAGTAWQNFGEKKGTATNLYAATKEAFEAILRYYADAKGLRAYVLKLNDTYGPDDTRRKLISILRDASLKAEPIGLSPGEQKLDLLHVRDVVAAFQLAAKNIANESAGVKEYYLRSGRLTSVRDLIILANQFLPSPLAAIFGERPYRPREVMMPWQQGEVLPGWSPKIRLEDGLKEYFNENRHV